MFRTSFININRPCEPVKFRQPSRKLLQQMYLIKWSTGAFQNWGIFLLSKPDHTNGIHWELIINDRKITGSKASSATLFPRHGRKKNYMCRRKIFDLERTKRGQLMCIRVDGAVSTPERVDAATNRVIQDFKYKLISENCQSFAIETLITLHRWYPDMVKQNAIDMVRRESAINVRMAASIRQKRTSSQLVYLYENERTPSRPHFTTLSEAAKPMRSRLASELPKVGGNKFLVQSQHHQNPGSCTTATWVRHAKKPNRMIMQAASEHLSSQVPGAWAYD
jgi:hypothetical protein